MKSLKWPIVLSIFVFLSCTNDDDDPIEPDVLTEYQEDVIEYFKEIALGFEFGGASEITRKWNGPMRIFVSGTLTTELEEELQDIIVEINDLVSDGFSAEIVEDSLISNYHIFLGSGEAYANIYPGQQNLVQSNWGLFSVFWNNNFINRGHMYVDIDRADLAEEKHLLREELTQSLGLAKDSQRYPNSIFQQDWTSTNEYTDIDKDLIRLLYHPDMSVDLNETQVDAVLRQILLNE